MIRYAVTQRSSFPGDEAQRTAQLLRLAARWAADGVDFVQLREKDLEAGALANLATKLSTALGQHIRLLINGRADVAIATGAAGVHLTAHPGELTPDQVRQTFAAAGAGTPIISASCHTLVDVERMQNAGADLILFGPIFEKRVADKVVVPGIGLEQLHAAGIAASPAKILALGGVTPHNAKQCIVAGAAGIAGIRLFTELR